MDDNELYRSNSFKFEKFKRDEVISNCNTLPRPVSIFEQFKTKVKWENKLIFQLHEY